MWKTASARNSTAVERELKRLQRTRRLRRYWGPVFCGAAICILLLHFVVRIHIVSGASMAPSLLPGDVIICWMPCVEPERGDLVIIHEPTGMEMVKRVVGLAGDTLEITPEGHVIRNGQLLKEDAAWYGGQDSSQWETFPLVVPEGTVFCLGDNRPLSLDSRHRAIGPIPLKEVLGEVIFVLRWQR